MPWAKTTETSFVADAATYRRLLSESGLELRGERDRRAFAIKFFEKMRARVAASGPPPLGLHLIMGAEFAQKMANMIANLQSGLLSPVEMICRAR